MALQLARWIKWIKMKRAGKGSAPGQVMLEVAISMVSIVAFFYILLNVWQWLNVTLAGRQAAFQQSRLDAGKPNSAGKPVPYVTPRISLIGPPGSGTGLDLWEDGIPQAPCEAAKPFFEQAQLRLEEARTLQTEVDALKAQLEEKQEDVEGNARWLEDAGRRLNQCFADGHTDACVALSSCGCHCPPPGDEQTVMSNLICAKKTLEENTSELQEIVPQLQDKLIQLQLKLQEVQELIQQGTAACLGQPDGETDGSGDPGGPGGPGSPTPF